MPANTQNVIHETTDYSQFQILTANRDTNRAHIEAIKKSIERNGNFTQFAPVLVNDKMEIIDGQHRYTALRELGLPVHYIVTKGAGVKQAREMNKLNKGWGMLDWAKTYANSGYTSYRNFQTILDEYEGSGIAPSVLLQYAVGGFTKGMYAEFRDGNLILPNEALPRARARLVQLEAAVEANEIMKNGTMAEAFLMASQVPGFNLKRMLTKLREYPQISHFQTKLDNLRHLEDIYNYRYSADNRLRFF